MSTEIAVSSAIGSAGCLPNNSHATNVHRAIMITTGTNTNEKRSTHNCSGNAGCCGRYRSETRRASNTSVITMPTMAKYDMRMPAGNRSPAKQMSRP